MAIQDFLQRFRPAGAPGAPGRAAVPADRVAEATAELAPVFAALADVHPEVDGIRSRAVARAAARRRAAAEEAERIRADAPSRRAARRSAPRARRPGPPTPS